jgi:hypothetical protein
MSVLTDFLSTKKNGMACAVPFVFNLFFLRHDFRGRIVLVLEPVPPTARMHTVTFNLFDRAAAKSTLQAWTIHPVF